MTLLQWQSARLALHGDQTLFIPDLKLAPQACWAFVWLITSCRSANNIMPITFFLPAFIASSFYSA